jgi:hypothetical protein
MKTTILLCSVGALALASLAVAGEDPGYRTLQKRVTFSTDEGVTAYAEGTEVLVLSEQGGKCTVKIGAKQYEVDARDLSVPARTPTTAALASSLPEVAKTTATRAPVAQTDLAPEPDATAPEAGTPESGTELDAAVRSARTPRTPNAPRNTPHNSVSGSTNHSVAHASTGSGTVVHRLPVVVPVVRHRPWGVHWWVGGYSYPYSPSNPKIYTLPYNPDYPDSPSVPTTPPVILTPPDTPIAVENPQPGDSPTGPNQDPKNSPSPGAPPGAAPEAPSDPGVFPPGSDDGKIFNPFPSSDSGVLAPTLPSSGVRLGPIVPSTPSSGVVSRVRRTY